MRLLFEIRNMIEIEANADLRPDALEKTEKLEPVIYTQFPVNIVNMILNRMIGNKKFIFDVFLTFPEKEQPDDFLFPFR